MDCMSAEDVALLLLALVVGWGVGIVMGIGKHPSQ